MTHNLNSIVNINTNTNFNITNRAYMTNTTNISNMFNISNNKNIEKPKLLKYDNPTIRKPQNSQVHENRTTNEKIKHMNIRS